MIRGMQSGSPGSSAGQAGPKPRAE